MPHTEWPAALVRKTFVDFFVDKCGHAFYPSSPTIPHEDPTLLFANAGMNQFKAVFLGTVSPSSPFATLKRIVNSQKCIRAGGKHNDLDDVGKDSYHHTFFEMLGNWSFGDYFKKEAITWSWELLTNVFKLDKSRLYVTYFGGDKAQNLSPDNEAKEFWISVGVDPSRVVPYGCKENFWEMGDQGPCGPCSEIHYDLTETERFVPELVNADDPTLIEIWNLVFIQFNRECDSSLRLLPAKHVDTGMGFERIVCALQKKTSNYDTDVFAPIFEQIHLVTGIRPYSGLMGAEDKEGIDMAYRVVADHVRTLTMSISDGGFPSNEGRGYVLRRILRRGVRYASRFLNVKPGNFFSSLVDTVVKSLTFFPEAGENIDLVKSILDDEEKGFARTLGRGSALFDIMASKATNGIISGADAWRLYDTFGFPVDLTRLMAEERNLKIDDVSFEKEQQKARELSKKGAGSGSAVNSIEDQVSGILDGSIVPVLEMNAFSIDLAAKKNIPKTEDIFKYDSDSTTPLSSNVVGIMNRENKDEPWVDCCSNSMSQVYGILLNKTNFYAVSGGQEHDVGSIIAYTDDGEIEGEFAVGNVMAFGGYVLHIGVLKSGKISCGMNVTASYDTMRRTSLTNNHTATHVLNLALLQVLGNNVDQKGSLVAETKLRFDFSHRSAMTIDEIIKVEDLCNQSILNALEVHVFETKLSDARKVNGLRAVFGETYPDLVRVVSIGATENELKANPDNAKWAEYSIELCGGTHVSNTNQLKRLVILEESSIAKGIRRIIATTAKDAQVSLTAASLLRSRIEELEREVALSKKTKGSLLSLATPLKEIARELDNCGAPMIQLSQLRKRFNAVKESFDNWDKERKAAAAATAIDNVNIFFTENSNAPYLVSRLGDNVDPKVISAAVSAVKGHPGKSALFVAVDTIDNKLTYHAVVDDTFTEKINALDWVGVVADAVGGKKGGRQTMAQGASNSIGNINAAIKLAEEFAKARLM